MSNEVPLPENEIVDQVRESRIYAKDPETGSYHPIELSNGRLLVDAKFDGGEVNITDDDARVLGDVDVTSLPEPLDVSASAIQADVTDQTGRNLGKARLMASDETLIDPPDSGDMTPLSVSTSTTGASNAAQLDLGSHRKDVDVFYDVSGSATVTVEVSTDADTWRTFHAESLSSAASDILQFETSYRYIRAYADSNLKAAEIVSKGD